MDSPKNITFKCPACGTGFLSLSSSGQYMTCPHCAAAAPRQSFLSPSSKPVEQTRKTAPSHPAKTTLPLAGNMQPHQSNPTKQRSGWAWVLLIFVAGAIGTAAIYLSLKHQTTLAATAPTEDKALEPEPPANHAIDYGSPMMHEGLIRPLADRLLKATDVNAFAANFANGNSYLKEMETVWEGIKQFSPDFLAITMVPITSLPDNNIVYLGVWPHDATRSLVWVTLQTPVDTQQPKLNWPLFYQSYTQQIDNLFAAPSGQSAKSQVIVKRTHAFDLSDTLKRDYAPVLVQCTKNEAVLATAFVEKNTPKGENLLSTLQWNQTYLLRAILTRKSIDGTIITVISDAEIKG